MGAERKHRHGVQRKQNVIIWGIIYTGMKNAQRQANSLHFMVEALRKRTTTLLTNIVSFYHYHFVPLSFQHVFNVKKNEVFYIFFFSFTKSPKSDVYFIITANLNLD